MANGNLYRRKGHVYIHDTGEYLPIVPLKSKISEMLLDGSSRKSCAEYLKEKGLTKSSIDRLILTVQDEITKTYQTNAEFRLRKNIAVLEKVIEDELRNHHYGNVLKAVKEINMMVGAYNTDTNVQINLNNGGFDFSFGGVQPQEIIPQDIIPQEIIDITPNMDEQSED